MSRHPERPTGRAFTALVLRHLFRDPDMRETVGEWFEEEADPEARVRGFAAALAEDVVGPFEIIDPHDSPEVRLYNRVVVSAFRRVAWRRVARVLLRRLGPRPPWALRGSLLN